MCLCETNCSLDNEHCCKCLDKRTITSSRYRGIPQHLREKPIFARRMCYVDGGAAREKLAVFWTDYCSECQMYYCLAYRLIKHLIFFAGSSHIGSVSIPPDVNLAEFIITSKNRLSRRFAGMNITFENPFKRACIIVD